jgi:hypothetical protein
VANITELEDGRTKLEFNDISPFGMFEKGFLIAQEYDDLEVTINCNATIWVSDKNGTSFKLRARKGQKTLPWAVTVIGKRKDVAPCHQK